MSRCLESNESSASFYGVLAIRWRWFWLALMMAPLPMFGHYLIWNWQYEQYHFFPLLLVAVSGIAYSRFNGTFAAPRGWFCWATICLGMVTVLGSLALDTPWLSAIALVFCASAMLSSMSGLSDASLIGLSLPMWLLVRLPLGYDQILVLRLQSITTQLTSVVLDTVRVPHAVSGNVIQLADRELFVAEACSGIQSVFTLAFIASLLIPVNRRPLILFPVYLVVACVLAVAANVLRVSSVVVGQAWFGLDLASGWPHEIVGYIALAIGIGLLLSFDHLLVAIVHPIADVGEQFNPLVDLWNRGVGNLAVESSAISRVSEQHGQTQRVNWMTAGLYWSVSAIALLLLIASSTIAVARHRPNGQDAGMYASIGPIIEPRADLLDNTFSTIQVTDHTSVRDGANPRLGENADVWSVNVSGREAELVLSQTYKNWHEFCLCYEIDGWRLLNREIDVSDGKQFDAPFATALFSRDDGRMGQLLYAGIDSLGNVIDPPEMAGRLSSRFDRTSEETQNVLMLQLWMTGNRKLDTRLYSDVKSDFVNAVRLISSELNRLTKPAIEEDPASSPMPPARGVE